MAREWNPRTEYPVIKRMAKEGAGVEAIARALDRSEKSVKHKAYELGISLRKKGSKRGLVLGQPRCVSLSNDPGLIDVRELIITGRIDMAVVLERVSLSTDPDAELCPHCTVRLVSPSSRFGLCPVCHKRELVEALNDELALLEVKRDQQVAWKRIERAKKQIGGAS